MEYYFAPMEGATSYLFRTVHRKYFDGVDKYYMPFISPTQDHLFTKRELRELVPEHNQGFRAVPQLLSKRAEDCVWAARGLAEMGYPEINLNLGCPSGTVVAKGKGAGLLRDTAVLKDFLQEIYDAGLPVDISVKTRLGMNDPEEFEAILEVYNRFPISQLTIHPRVKVDLYKGHARVEEFAKALPKSRAPVCYNGDLMNVAQIGHLAQKFPEVGAVMMGRGFLADPALAQKAAGGKGADKARLEGFVDELYRSYAQVFESDRNAMLRMKELWFYLINLFADSVSYGKKLKKVSDPREYEALVKGVLRDLELKPHLDGEVFLK